MKRVFILLYTCLGVLDMVVACDKCACNISGQSGGISELVYKNGMSLQYTNAFYKSNHQGKSSDAFNACILAGNYYLNERLKLNLNIPYQWNKRYSDDGNSQNMGFGDIRLMLQTNLLKAKNLGTGFRMDVQLGLGLKLPTGKYVSNLHDQNLPENFNTGNGALGLNVQTSMAITKNQIGWYVGAYYLQHFKSKDNYFYGHQWSLSSFLFVKKEWSNGFMLTPQTGLIWEYSLNDKGVNGFQIDNTGGWGLLVPIGFSLRKESILLNLLYFLPIQQNYAGGDSQLRNKMAVDLHYFF